MDEDELIGLVNGEEDEVCRIINDFNEKNRCSFHFPDLPDETKKKLARASTKILSSYSCDCHPMYLEFVRIICRNKANIPTLLTDDLLLLIKDLALLGSDNEHLSSADSTNDSPPSTIQAVMLVYNLVLVNPEVQTFFCSNGILEAITDDIRKLQLNTEANINLATLLMKILMLLTAHLPQTRKKVECLSNGLDEFNMLLEKVLETMNKCDCRSTEGQLSSLVCVILMVLYNLISKSEEEHFTLDDVDKYFKLVATLRNILVVEIPDQTAKSKMALDVARLLIHVPGNCYENLMDGSDDESNFEAIKELLKLLDRKVDDINKEQMGNADATLVVNQILTSLCICCKKNDKMRKFFRSKVLPPLRNVHNRPEEGPSLRSRLCKMMTSPNFHLKSVSAEFLFILCKCNVKRLVKYSGYGNAAGLLASHGLMLGNREKPAEFSSDTEDSETEEYAMQKDRINPIVGCCEEPHEDPLANMSEERKEYEALQLVNLMDKLIRNKVIHPTKIGEDGKPHPVEHVLELQQSSQNSLQQNE